MSSDKQAVERYSAVLRRVCGRPDGRIYPSIEPDSMGSYVSLKDYEKLAAEVKRLRQELSDLVNANCEGYPYDDYGDIEYKRIEAEVQRLRDSEEYAWTIIANAGVTLGDWSSMTPDWQDAAKRWRDDYTESRAKLYQEDLSKETLKPGYVMINDQLILAVFIEYLDDPEHPYRLHDLGDPRSTFTVVTETNTWKWTGKTTSVDRCGDE